jgi:hypothetical protein
MIKIKRLNKFCGATSILRRIFSGIALFGMVHSPLMAQPFPPPKWLGDTNEFGLHLQRAMTLLATSTPTHRHTVKILFYGQSITGQDWWKIVAEDLRRRFPDADLVIENRAIGGFASQLLVKTAETDLYTFYPDLLIFHVFGSDIEYENIIRRMRERTTAEILMQNDHVTKDVDFTEETDPAKLYPNRTNWDAYMDHKFLPKTAKRYDAALCDQRSVWKHYLQDYQLPPTRLLKDSVHLNLQGEFLMAECVKPWLAFRNEKDNLRSAQPMNCDLVKTWGVGSEVEWTNNRLTLDFTGNRVDLICKPGPASAVKILIDGKKPSAFPNVYALTRTTSFPGTKWPCLLQVRWIQPWQLEEWTLTLHDISPDLKHFKFTCEGSRTGPDGEGSATERFVSKSGRVVFDPTDWNLEYARKISKEPLPEGFKIKWQVLPHFVDEFTTPSIADSTRETVVTVAQGLDNKQHRLEIIGNVETPIAAIRAYCPPLKGNQNQIKGTVIEN